MYKLKICLIALSLLSISSCDSASNDNLELSSQKIKTDKESTSPINAVLEEQAPNNDSEIIISESRAPQEIEPVVLSNTINYELLHKKIAYGKASLADVRKALTDTNASALTNTIHALYSMRGHRGVYNLLFDMWKLNKNKYPELAWEKISNPPARIALASTINRIQIINTDEYKDYIRSFKDDKHEFHLAQVVVSLGFNGAPDDVEYIKTMADGPNHYVAQSAITALAIMGGNFARNAMIELYNSHKNTQRGELLETLLLQAYEWRPVEIDVKTNEIPD